ncbi:glyoxalase [Aphanothece hegewaldii CCALA 016]|uniref:Glyoxalase n=1 Tax=Aphanothece hegewaldii CCALA 016 TaxID=2107694 RepID=A0A2T1LWW2_9CHRO|nr:VOC family protein [Aphanothece hegewaldii]PSF36579.1 glyoxalase [Aphanothece hegewaldii CCALA 016]
MKHSVIFHLAIPISDIQIAKAFYCDGLGCKVGRENTQALILDFYGHQVVAHVTHESLTPQKGIYPRHFGLIFTDESDWEALVNRIKEQAISFYIEPKLRFSGQLTEHRSFFIEDPFYNLLEFKFYRHSEAIFGGRELTAIGDRV